MHAGGKYQPQKRLYILFFQSSRQGEYSRERRHIPRVQILVHDVERGPRHWNRQQGRHQADRSPLRSRTRKKEAGQFPTCEKQQENRGHLPQKQSDFHGQMGYPQKEGNNIGEEGQTGVRQEKFAPDRK